MEIKRRLESSGTGQAGFSLIEVIVTIAIAGTAVIAVIACVLTLLYSSEVHERSVQAGIEATDIAEQIELIPYRPCGTKTQYAADVTSLPVTGYTFTLESVEYLTSATASTAAFTTTPCAAAANDQGVQRLKIKVSSTGPRSASESITFVKRDQTCSAQANVPLGKLC